MTAQQTGEPWWLRGGVVTPRHLTARATGLLPGTAAVWSRLPRRSSLVALTFDDGPHPAGTPAVLAVLALHGASATFFMLSEQAGRFPRLVDDVITGGHEIGLHGDLHESLAGLPVMASAPRLMESRCRLEDLAQRPVRLYRPPYGNVSLALLRAARLAGLHIVTWSHDPCDWDVTSRLPLLDRVSRCLRPGALVLLHDGGREPLGFGPATADALNRVLSSPVALGLRLCTLSEAGAWRPAAGRRPSA